MCLNKSAGTVDIQGRLHQQKVVEKLSRILGKVQTTSEQITNVAVEKKV